MSDEVKVVDIETETNGYDLPAEADEIEGADNG